MEIKIDLTLDFNRNELKMKPICNWKWKLNWKMFAQVQLACRRQANWTWAKIFQLNFHFQFQIGLIYNSFTLKCNVNWIFISNLKMISFSIHFILAIIFIYMYYHNTLLKINKTMKKISMMEIFLNFTAYVKRNKYINNIFFHLKNQ